MEGGGEGGGWREQGRDERGGNDRNNAQVLAQLHRGQSAPCWPANKQKSKRGGAYFFVSGLFPVVQSSGGASLAADEQHHVLLVVSADDEGQIKMKMKL